MDTRTSDDHANVFEQMVSPVDQSDIVAKAKRNYMQIHAINSHYSFGHSVHANLARHTLS